MGCFARARCACGAALLTQALSQQDMELLLSFLTVPYMRVPLMLNFFSSEQRIHALRSNALRDLFESCISLGSLPKPLCLGPRASHNARQAAAQSQDQCSVYSWNSHHYYGINVHLGHY